MAILYKTIPVWYSEKNKILYLDAIEEFDDSNFKILKKVSKSNPLSKYATHKIKLYNTENQNEKFHFLLLKIENMIVEGKLQFGHPLGINYDHDMDTQEIDNSEGLINFTSNDERYNLGDDFNLEGYNAHITINSKQPKLISVGQGLSFVDEPNNFMYDAGGTIGYSKFISKINTKIQYSIALSHPHYDHFKYISKLIDDKLVKEIFMSKH